ncbi:MAG: hypothetical protein KGJ02_01875 [Verrucomicrobiota bacterium]|nr:hypothetical protein [Verrucomicrobiota bacterium]
MGRKDINTQINEVLYPLGSTQTINREGLALAVEAYLDTLPAAAAGEVTCPAGQLEEGLEDVSFDFPEDNDLVISQMIWEKVGGYTIDPTLRESQFLIASAILFSFQV